MDEGIEIPTCPFDSGTPQLIAAGGIAAYTCMKCGTTGPTASAADYGARYTDVALTLWRQRGGLGHVRVAAVPTNINRPTFDNAQKLHIAADRIASNEFGAMDAFLLVPFNPSNGTMTILVNGVGPPLIAELARKTYDLVTGKAANQVASPNSRIILPR